MMVRGRSISIVTILQLNTVNGSIEWAPPASSTCCKVSSPTATSVTSHCDACYHTLIHIDREQYQLTYTYMHIDRELFQHTYTYMHIDRELY